MTSATVKSMIYLAKPKKARVSGKIPEELKEGIDKFQQRDGYNENQTIQLALANFLRQEGLLSA